MNLKVTKHLRHGVTLLAFGAIVPLSNCESALSDVEITDPSVLQTHFVVERSLFHDGTIVSSLHTTIFDKNLASVELKNGHVKVNGQQMSVTEILNISTYYIPQPTINLNTDYIFELVLANGESYTGTVKTPAKTFTSVTVPPNSKVDSDLTITWSDIYVHDDLVVSLNLTSPAGTVPGATFNLTDAQMQAGSFVIPKSSFSSPAGITGVTITLTGANYGSIDQEFRSGSSAISRMRVEKKVVFN
jgi:hypothetical protein